jgi:hypothetical protein
MALLLRTHEVVGEEVGDSLGDCHRHPGMVAGQGWQQVARLHGQEGPCGSWGWAQVRQDSLDKCHILPLFCHTWVICKRLMILEAGKAKIMGGIWLGPPAASQHGGSLRGGRA